MGHRGRERSHRSHIWLFVKPSLAPFQMKIWGPERYKKQFLKGLETQRFKTKLKETRFLKIIKKRGRVKEVMSLPGHI